MCDTRPAHLILLHFIIQIIWRGVQILKLLNTFFPLVSFYPSQVQKIPLSTLFSEARIA
jgi:hypothetical protein